MFKHIQLLAFALCALLVIPAVAQVPSYVPTDGLVGWWPFNGNANDESGNGNDGVVNGATLTEDRFGSANAAYGFDSSAITLPYIQQNLHSFSVTLWFKTTLGGYIFAGSRDCNGGVGSRLDINQDGLYKLVFGADDNGYTDGKQTLDALNDGEWHNVVGVWNGDNFLSIHPNQFSIYLDGVLVNQVDYTSVGSGGLGGHRPIPMSGSAQCTLGSGPCYPSEFSFGYVGLIDDVGLWTRALTEQEIQNLYTGQCPTVSTNCTSLPSNLQQGLVGYWPFCGNANDESGNGNDGVVNGASLTEDRFGNADKAYGFDGSTVVPTYISGDCSNFPTASRTVSLWFYANDIGSTIAGRALLGYGGETCGQSWLMNIDNPGNGGNLFEVQGHCQNEQVLYNYGDLNPNNSWYHWLITTDSVGTNFYLNGELVVESDTFIDETVVNGKVFVFGGMSSENGLNYLWDGNANPFNGKLDDIGIWNRALTAEEVQELYTLDACTFTVYDTLTVYETVYDTVYTYETIYDTVTTYVTVTDTLLIDITFTGFEGQPSWLNTVTVFPNPASDHITIDYGNFALMAGYNTIITDAAGATVYSSAVNSQQVEIDINAWGATGVYYMSVYDASGELVAVRHIVLE